ncbi:hypothetical protein TWF481_006154 [Arthrobotrys musiformis]|uniref:Uncharacterized protein n=1 Tax=Arthrobotrys musiformis TaxID=47236 RepID=A0AAV9WFX7_9PEZI
MKKLQYLILLVFGILPVLARYSTAFPGSAELGADYIDERYPMWLKMILPTMICIITQKNPNYYNNTCLLTTDSQGLGLKASPDLATMTPDSEKVPLPGLWRGYMDLDEFDTGANKKGGGPDRNTFIIVSEEEGHLPGKRVPICLTWISTEEEYYVDMGPVQNISDSFSKRILDRPPSLTPAFGSMPAYDTKSMLSGKVVFETCRTSFSSLRLDFGDIPVNQKFWVLPEPGSEVEYINGDFAVAHLRIVPKLPWINDPWSLCSGYFGIFDTRETGEDPDYEIPAKGDWYYPTSIGWGCSFQKWTIVSTWGANVSETGGAY